RNAALRHSRAQQATLREGIHLSHAILYQQPESWRDALILTGHAFNMVDLNTSMDRDDWKALDAAMDSLFAFIADKGEAGETLGGWLGDSLRIARERSTARRRTAGEP
ncbi:MAG TPA: hypothetical protein VII91_12455, partial [Bauldia sp.]